MAQVTLINPPTVLYMRSLSYQNSIPPLGLAYLSAAAKAAGHRVQIIDGPGDAIEDFHPIEGSFDGLFLHGLTPEQIADRIDPDSDAIGITHMFLHAWPLVRDMVRRIKERFPDKPIIVGGETPTAFWPYMMEQSPAIDLCVLGEGEAILVDILEAIDDDRSWDTLEAVIYRGTDGRGVKSQGKRARNTELDKIAWPDWEAFNVEGYLAGAYASGVNRGRSIPMIGTRGCPYQCTFCSSPEMWTTRYVMRDPENVVDEIQHYVEKYNIDNVDFLDLTAIINRRWILQFCHALMNRGIEITWQLPSGTRSEAIDREVADALYASGCRNISYAPESGSPRMLDLIKKKVDLDNLTASLADSVKAGMITNANIILGLPGDTWKDMWLSYKFGMRLGWHGLHSLAVMMFAPYPGSELFDDLHKVGKVAYTEEYYYSALMRSGRSSVTYNKFRPGLLILIQFFFLCSFWSLQYLLRPVRLLKTLRQMFTPGNEESIMDKLLHAKMSERDKRRHAGTPVTFLAESPQDSSRPRAEAVSAEA